MIRKLPDRRSEGGQATPSEATSAAPPPGPSITGPTTPDHARAIEPLSPARYRIQFTASAAFHDKLERLTALMRRTAGQTDLATILEAAVTEKLQRLEARRFGSPRNAAKKHSIRELEKAKAPVQPESWAQPGSPVQPESPRRPETGDVPVSRHVPAPVRRAVYEREGGRCAYVNRDGKRCTARARLEFHHVHPYARGGATTAENLRLMCRTHNVELAERFFGATVMATYRRRRRREAAAQPLADGSFFPSASSGGGPSP
jgi:hypothetical protein